MADTVVFYEDENGMFFMGSDEAFTNDFSQALRFGETQAERLAQVSHEHYPQRVFEVGVVPT